MRLRSEMPYSRLVVLALRAAWELAVARLNLHGVRPAEVLRRNSLIAAAAASPLSGEAAASRCDEVAAVLSRMALRVPWRADCLVQAMAGQRWLSSSRVATEIVIGTAKSADGTFEAHAWLLYRGRVILGGDVARFQPLSLTDGNQTRPL